MTSIRREAFDRGDLGPFGAADWETTRPDRLAVQKYRTRSTLADPTSELGACETQRLAQDPEQGIGSGDVDVPNLSVEREFRHSWTSRSRINR